MEGDPMIFRSELNRPRLVLCCAVALLSACGGMGMGMNQKSGNSNSRGLFVSDGGGNTVAMFSSADPANDAPASGMNMGMDMDMGMNMGMTDMNMGMNTNMNTSMT